MIYGKDIMSKFNSMARFELMKFLKENNIDLDDYPISKLCTLEFKELRELTPIKPSKRKLFFEGNTTRLIYGGETTLYPIDAIIYDGEFFKKKQSDSLENITKTLIISLITLHLTYLLRHNISTAYQKEALNEIAICVVERIDGEFFKDTYERLLEEGYLFNYISENSLYIFSNVA